MELPKLEAPWCVISGSCTVSSRIGSVGAIGVHSPTGMNQGSRSPANLFLDPINTRREILWKPDRQLTGGAVCAISLATDE